MIWSLVILLFWIYTGILLYFGHRHISFLRDIPIDENNMLPRVSIIIPARNESRKIRKALESICAQDYAELEIIVINDRSTDNTGQILAELKKQDARLQVYAIEQLPDGWLGKNHALQYGAQHARGEILLFSDADIIMRPDTVSKAVACLEKNNLDHLAITPEVTMPGHFLGMITLAFTIFFSLYAFPWKVSDPDSKKHIGIGGFNMIRSSVYRAIGMHQTIALRPDDDMKLGMLVKKHRFKQDVLFGSGMLSVEWYSSTRELIDGLMKNAFAGMEYKITLVAGVSAAMVALFIWPYIAIFSSDLFISLLNFGSVLILSLACIDNSRIQNLPAWYCIGFPVCTLLLLYILWRAMILNIYHDGIYWRGTHYSLKQLKANKVKW